MNKLIISFCFVLLSFSVSAIECKTYNTRHIFKKASIEKKEKICITKFGDVAASSENCSDMNNKNCPFKGLKKDREFGSFISELGSPGFNLCHYLEGSPQIYEIEIAGKWTTFERCYGKKSSEFIDIDTLISAYKSL